MPEMRSVDTTGLTENQLKNSDFELREVYV